MRLRECVVCLRVSAQRAVCGACMRSEWGGWLEVVVIGQYFFLKRGRQAAGERRWQADGRGWWWDVWSATKQEIHQNESSRRPTYSSP